MEKLVNLKEGFWIDKKVLITGHTGFKGSWLSLWLSLLGAKVYGFSLQPETHPSLFNQLSLQLIKLRNQLKCLVLVLL